MVNKIKDFLLTYPKINDLIHIDSTDIKPMNYGLYSNGQQIMSINNDILGNKIITKRLNYVFYVVDVTLADALRLDNICFLEQLIEWLEDNPEKPTFGTNPKNEIWELSNNMLMEDNNKIGVYQLQINITFEKEVNNA